MEDRLIGVLLIDDDDDDYLIVSDLIQSGPLWTRLERASSYEEGMDALSKGQYDACLLDYRLGTSDGLTFLRAARAAGCTTPMIFLTGQGESQTAIAALKAGASDYIEKSTLTAALLSRILQFSIERERAARDLMESEQRLSLAMRVSGMANWDFDLETGDFRSSGGEPIFGIEDASLQKLGGFLELVHPDDRARFEQARQEMLAGKGGETLEYRIVRPDGRIRWVATRVSVFADSTGRPVRIVGVTSDVTDQRTALAELTELFDEAPVGYHEIDLEGQITRINRTELAMLGYAADEMLGRSVFEFIEERRREEARLWFSDQLSGYAPGGSFERTLLKKDGSTIPTLVMWRPLLNDRGVLAGFRIAVLDNRERKRAQGELQESNRRLEATLRTLRETQTKVIEQERLRAMGLLASGVAHDFNNALMPIMGFTELLLHDPETLQDPQKARRHLQMISIAAKDAANVVSRLQEFYRVPDEHGRFSNVHIGDLVAQVVSLTQVRWKDQAQANSISIEVKTELDDVPPVLGNESELRELLSNLILNAVDAMPNGGTITLRSREEAPYVVLEVQDTGVGMSEEVRKRCLDPLFTTKGKRGTGMGLTTVSRTIQRHEGTLEIESDRGVGTKFVIRLPIADSKGQHEADEAPATSQSLHILLVDDEPSVREVIEAYLTGDGHTVETATNGREALDMFLNDQFDLVLTDRAMPQMSGDQLAASIKTVAPRPVILLTGFGEIMQATGEKPAGVDLILGKPVALSELREGLSRAVASAEASQRE